MEVKIKVAKLLKNDIFEVTYTEREPQDQEPAIVTKEYKDPVHPDMKAAFSGCKQHLRDMAGYPETIDLETFYPTGYHYKEGNNSLQLTGYHILSNGKTITFNTPPQPLEETEETRFPYAGLENLIEKFNRLNEEVKAYLFQGKRQAVLQQELPFDQPEAVTNMKIDHAEELYHDAGEHFRPTVYADPEAMKRVAKMPNTKRKVKQTAENPDGEAA